MGKNGISELKKLKEKHQLTWPGLAKALGRSTALIENWYTGNAEIPGHSRILIEIFLNDEKLFEKHRLDK